MKKEKMIPMLAVDATKEIHNLRYPKLASKKLDGIRFWVIPEMGIVGRSLKPIRNKQILEKFDEVLSFAKKFNVILDGEFYNHDLTFEEIKRTVMNFDFTTEKTKKNIQKDFLEKKGIVLKDSEYEIYWRSLIDKIQMFVFDVVNDDIFSMRYDWLKTWVLTLNDLVVIVEQEEVHSAEEVSIMFEQEINKGYEGLILRDPNSPYKYGRSTLKEEWMLKVKPFETFDAQIIEVNERFTNTNEAEENKLGYSVRKNTKEGKSSTGIAATFTVMYNGSEVKPVIGGDELFRKKIWDNKESYIGKWIEYKGMLVGSTNVPRHVQVVRFREDRDN